jgi:hypothetical protein
MQFSMLKKGSTGESVLAWQRFLQTRGLNLEVDGQFGSNTDEATRAFQSTQGLEVDGKVGPKTFAKALELGFSLVDDDETDDETDDEDAVDGHGGPLGAEVEPDDPASVKPDPEFRPSIQDRRDFGARRFPADKHRRQREPDAKVNGIVLHQMAFSRGSDLRRYDGVTAHYVVMPDGQIGWLHGHDIWLPASNRFNATTIAVEFAGNLPSTRGRWWNPAKAGMHHLTPRQVSAGRFLLQHLKDHGVISHVFAHIQSAGANRANCPGPDIWSSIGQWGVETLGLDDGGPGFAIPHKHGMGLPIPDAWRTWGRS